MPGVIFDGDKVLEKSAGIRYRYFIKHRAA